MTKYIIIKLNTGEEIIGKHTDVSELYVELTDPFQVMSKWAPNGEFQMGMVPFFPFAEKNIIQVNHTGYTAYCTPVPDLVKEYTKQTSGILIP